jgi:hypothetical protein
MEYLALLLVVGVVAVVWYARTTPQRSPAAAPALRSDDPDRPAADHPRSTALPPLRATADGSGFVFTPGAGVELTLTGLTEPQATAIRDRLESGDWSDRGSLTLAFARGGARCPELDAYVAKWSPLYRRRLEQLKGASPEWSAASELDREDLEVELAEKALDAVLERPRDTHALQRLLAGPPADLGADDELLRLLGDDADAFSTYLSLVEAKQRCAMIAADDSRYATLVKAVERGLARRGTDVPADVFLDQLRLKDLNAMMADRIAKPFTRKAPALEFARTLPDLKERLSKVVPVRQMFQATPPPGLDADAAAQAYGYAAAQARLFRATYGSWRDSMLMLDGYQAGDRVRVSIQPADECPSAQKHAGKTTARRPARVPPYHIGCDCHVNVDYE